MQRCVLKECVVVKAGLKIMCVQYGDYPVKPMPLFFLLLKHALINFLSAAQDVHPCIVLHVSWL